MISRRRTQAENFPRLLLAAMRWLDRIVDGSGMADKIMVILSVTSKFHQVEVIVALPESASFWTKSTLHGEMLARYKSIPGYTYMYIQYIKPVLL